MDHAEAARHDALIRRLLPEALPPPVPAVAEVMFRVMRDGKRGRAGESADECSCVLLAAVGQPLETETMLSKFPSRLVAGWLREQGLPG
jgi:hypothetical protein